MKGFKNKKGISLIVLVITIIVMIILAAAIILSLSNSGIIGKSNEAKFKSDVETMQEELAVLNANNTLEGSNAVLTIDDLTSAKNYKDKFVVQDGKLKYVAAKLTAEEITWARGYGIKSTATELVNGQNGVKIENGTITVDDKSAFDLTDIEIPEGVTTIGVDAFMDCSSLTSVIIPEGVTTISGSAFCHSGLTSIVLPSSLKNISTDVFALCSSLTSIIIPEGVTSIDVYAFDYCESLKNIVIEGNARFDADDVKSWFNVTDISDITITGTGYAG